MCTVGRSTFCQTQLGLTKSWVWQKVYTWLPTWLRPSCLMWPWCVMKVRWQVIPSDLKWSLVTSLLLTSVETDQGAEDFNQIFVMQMLQALWDQVVLVLGTDPLTYFFLGTTVVTIQKHFQPNCKHIEGFNHCLLGSGMSFLLLWHHTEARGNKCGF